MPTKYVFEHCVKSTIFKTYFYGIFIARILSENRCQEMIF